MNLAPAGNISFEVETGQRLRLTQPEGEQVADLISFNRDDVRELLSMHSSRAVNLNWKLTAPHMLYSNRTRPMLQIEDDLTGENYCGGGYCSEHLNVERYGDNGFRRAKLPIEPRNGDPRLRHGPLEFQHRRLFQRVHDRCL